LQERIDRAGPLELKEILRIGHQTACGLAAAHAQGIVHRDIKPANILLENGIERVKLTDFGLARTVDDASVTQSGVIAGTPLFMSPEQAAGESVDHRSDLFSLGSVLYMMCTGHAPFRASGTMAVMKRVIEDPVRPVRESNLEIPDWLEAVIANVHAKKPADRFQSANEVAQLLEQHLAHLQQPGQVPMPARVEPPPVAKPAHRGWWAALLGAALLLIVASTAAWIFKTQFPAAEGSVDLRWDDPSLRVHLLDHASGDIVYVNGGENGAGFTLAAGAYDLSVYKGNELVHQQQFVLIKDEKKTITIPEWGEMRFDVPHPDIRLIV